MHTCQTTIRRTAENMHANGKTQLYRAYRYNEFIRTWSDCSGVSNLASQASRIAPLRCRVSDNEEEYVHLVLEQFIARERTQARRLDRTALIWIFMNRLFWSDTRAREASMESNIDSIHSNLNINRKWIVMTTHELMRSDWVDCGKVNGTGNDGWSFYRGKSDSSWR